jgi:hypothetical protein
MSILRPAGRLATVFFDMAVLAASVVAASTPAMAGASGYGPAGRPEPGPGPDRAGRVTWADCAAGRRRMRNAQIARTSRRS